ncbi:L-fuculose kinase [Bacteroidia bacterium]|nr:L-fuculose kinase [Bacteroidia bacterium]GHT51579.1 L-fuculose kinase [Bacteroidia bacterium]
MAYLAIDLGAGSGRAIVGNIRDNRIELDEVHRFSNRQIRLGDTLYWDFPALFAEIKQGIFKAVQKGYSIQSIAVDTWGVDFGLLDKQGRLLSNPVCYRDARTQGILQEAFKKISKEKLYESTGNQLMEINTVFQLFSLVQSDNPQLAIADKLLFTPDLVNYFLTGFIGNEYTIASTSQLLNAKSRTWEPAIFEALHIPQQLMSPIVFPGTVIGKLRPEIAAETGAEDVNVIAVGSHDTASAVAAIPASADENWAFLSSGTWSLLGIELDKAITTPEAMENNFTNEGGVGNKIRFLTNITGLWLLQCLMSEWEKEAGNPVSYEYLLEKCTQATDFQSIVNPDDAAFVNPSSMSKAIVDYCIRTQQTAPKTKGEFTRCVLQSLALKYASAIESLKKCTHQTITKLYIVGGGSKNELLNQYTADAAGVEVVTGISESTVLGNVIQQAISGGQISGIEEGRKIVRNSFKLTSYQPQNTA